MYVIHGLGVITLAYQVPTKTAGPAQGRVSPNKQSGKRAKPKSRDAVKKQSMLNTHKLSPFKYDMNEILSNSTLDPSVASSFLASIIAKASRVSTREAKEFMKTFLDSGQITKEESDRISRLLDKYSKFR